jgi:hypothetical protein
MQGRPKALSASKTLDLRHAAIAISQFHRDRFSRGRKLPIGLRVVGNDAGIPGITGRHFQNLIGYRRVNADAHRADRATIRYQMGVIDQQPVKLAKRQPAGGLLRQASNTRMAVRTFLFCRCSMMRAARTEASRTSSSERSVAVARRSAAGNSDRRSRSRGRHRRRMR